MILHGFTKAGKQRFRCKNCLKTNTRKRDDVTQRRNINIIKHWIIKYYTISQLIDKYKLSKNRIQIIISETLKSMKFKKPIVFLNINEPLILDAKWIENKKVLVCIAHNGKQIIYFDFFEREHYETWKSFLWSLRDTPLCCVSDGQKGLKKAIEERFNIIKHQRCIFHVIKFSKQKLTSYPKDTPNIQLLTIVKNISKIHTEEEMRNWIKTFDSWILKHKDFLGERNYRNEYLHKKTRSVKSLLVSAIPNMFFYLKDERIPRTTNYVEGGVNGPLSFVISRHRGMNLDVKIQAIRYYLLDKMSKS
jgi:Transposase, Mutator family